MIRHLGAAMAAALILAASPPTVPVETGRDIYEFAAGNDVIDVRMQGGEWLPARQGQACAACHGASGEGGSEGGVAAPPLDRFTAMEPGAAERRVQRALKDHRGADGRSLGLAMPYYRMSPRDLAALVTYLRSLPHSPAPGVDTSTITIDVVTQGSPLSDAGLAVLSSVLDQAAAEAAHGGLFGRTIRFAINRDPTEGGRGLIGIVWLPGGEGRETALAVRTANSAAHNADDSTGPTRCGTLDPPAAEREHALASALEARGEVVVFGDAAEDGTNARSVIVQRADAPELRSVPALATVYAPAELVARLAPSDRAAGLRIVTPGDIARRAQAAQVLAAQTTLGPAEALAVAVYAEAAKVLVDAISRQGHRMTRIAVCNSVRDLARSRWSISVVSGNQAELVPVGN